MEEYGNNGARGTPKHSQESSRAYSPTDETPSAMDKRLDRFRFQSNGTTEPSIETTEPSVEATQPSVQTTEPSVQTTEPSVQVTQPPIQTTEPSLQATQPSVQESEPPIRTAGQENQSVNKTGK